MIELEMKPINKKISPQPYDSFIKGLDIKDIRLTSAAIKNIDCSFVPSAAEIKLKTTADYKNENTKVEVFHSYNLRILEKGKLRARLNITFCVSYTSSIPMNDEIFKDFSTRNLPINTWPYFREFVHNTLMRMGWSPFIAPAFKA